MSRRRRVASTTEALLALASAASAAPSGGWWMVNLPIDPLSLLHWSYSGGMGLIPAALLILFYTRKPLVGPHQDSGPTVREPKSIKMQKNAR